MELWRIYTSLFVYWEDGFRMVWVKNDFVVSVRMIDGRCNSTHPYATILFAIQELRSYRWECCISCELREGNQVANY